MFALLGAGVWIIILIIGLVIGAVSLLMRAIGHPLTFLLVVGQWVIKLIGGISLILMLIVIFTAGLHRDVWIFGGIAIAAVILSQLIDMWRNKEPKQQGEVAQPQETHVYIHMDTPQQAVGDPLERNIVDAEVTSVKDSNERL
jgi:hypothetical protein